MQIKPMRENEVTQVQKIAEHVILHNYAPFLGLEAAHDYIESGQSDQEINKGKDCCFVMKEEGCVIGFAIIEDDLLHLLMIDVPYQHKGYGTRLLEHVETFLFQHYPTLRLQSFEQNTSALSFYEKNGWCITGKESNENIVMLLLEKPRQIP